MESRRFLLAWMSTAGLFAAACGASAPAADDAPSPATSSAPPAADAGAAPRSGDTDAAHGTDTAPPAPARADVPAIACEDDPAGVYDATVAALPPMTMALRGSIMRCGKDGALDATAIAQHLAAQAVTGIVATSETTVYRIAFRTYRDDGVAGISTARVYLPTKPRSLPLPVIAVAHPTVGIADDC